MSDLSLETERLVLRMPRLSDAAPFAALFNDPTAMEFIGGVHPETVSTIQRGNVASVRVAEKIGETFERDVMVKSTPSLIYAIET